MAIIVSDANIFIDLEVAALIRQMFRLPDDFATPDILYQEELSEEHSELPALGLRIERLTPEAMADVAEMRIRYQAPSTNDLFALALAKANSWPLLTGDRILAKVSSNEGVLVNGTIWLVEQMVISRVITVQEASDGFERMRERARRLPWVAVDRLIRRLSDNDL